MLIDFWGRLKLSSHAEADILTSAHSNECTLGLENLWAVKNVLLVCMMYMPIICSNTLNSMVTANHFQVLVKPSYLFHDLDTSAD